MAKDPRDGARNALNKFYQKQADIASNKGVPVERKSPNRRPEKDVEKECLAWMRKMAWTVNIYESKAVWNAKAETWSQSGMRFGTCDCMGNMEDGVAVAVEFKAPGKLSSFNREDNFKQRQFIFDRINTNVFACVVDSARRLEEIYEAWLVIRALDKAKAREYLISSLPQISERTRLKSERLFDDD